MSDHIADSVIHAMKHTTRKLTAGRAQTTESQGNDNVACNCGSQHPKGKCPDLYELHKVQPLCYKQCRVMKGRKVKL